MKWIGYVCLCSLAAALITCRPTPPTGSTSAPTEAERQQMDERVQQYFKKTANLPPNVTLKVVDIAVADLPGLLTANLEASNGTNTQKVPLVLSRDGRYMIQGQLADLTADPFKIVRDKIALTDQPIRGNPQASVTIVEYSDFQCPFCSRAYKMVEEQALKDYGDKVRLVYKNYPLPMHNWAESAALASACARQQGADVFWKLYDYFFQNQQSVTLETVKEKAAGVVRDAGKDSAVFETCFDNKAALDAVKAEQQEATNLGVRSTPTFFINGRKVEGAVPYENFKAAIDEALGAGGKAGDAGSAARPG